ncbi:MAG: hypothetical protein ABI862_07335 [Ilumatobacteraceae bacterium]
MEPDCGQLGNFDLRQLAPGTGTVDVHVVNADGTSASTPADRFTYTRFLQVLTVLLQTKVQYSGLRLVVRTELFGACYVSMSRSKIGSGLCHRTMIGEGRFVTSWLVVSRVRSGNV